MYFYPENLRWFQVANLQDKIYIQLKKYVSFCLNDACNNFCTFFFTRHGNALNDVGQPSEIFQVSMFCFYFYK